MSTTTSFEMPQPTRDQILSRPLSENPIWKDITPVKQDDGEKVEGIIPVVPIK